MWSIAFLVALIIRWTCGANRALVKWNHWFCKAWMGRKPKERCYGWRCCITQPAKGVCFFPDLRLTMELSAWKRAILRINVGMDQSLIRWCFRVQPIGPLRYHSEIAIGWWRSVQFHCGVWQLHAITTIVKLTNYGKTNCETKHTELQHSETSNNSLCFFSPTFASLRAPPCHECSCVCREIVFSKKWDCFSMMVY